MKFKIAEVRKKMKPSKPKKPGNPYTIRLDETLRQRLDVWCERNEMLLSQAIRLAIKRLLESKKHGE